ncbi:MAG: class I SAM-dependent DNA methyltransferase [Solirubrobacterales bacterium]
MNLAEIEERVAAIEDAQGVEFLYGLLEAYGLPKASISRLRSGSYDKAVRDDERLWKGKVWFRDAREVGDDGLYTIIDAAKSDEAVDRLKPRFLIVRNESRLLAVDSTTGATLDIPAAELADNASFFLPWAGIEKTQLENLNVADIKAAEKMAKLYDEVTKHNAIETEAAIHDLNVFFSRLLFCFFAEDTGVFEAGSFTNAIGSLTEQSGADTGSFLDQLFVVLDTEPTERTGVPPHLRDFGYVNGKLFEGRSPAPRFTARARAIILDCGTLDWSQINPDIFGSMIQAVVHPSRREGLGMHYTSVENIMKVIRPLFLDELEEAFTMADTVRKLDRLLTRLSEIQIFDPACGSGNFLVISYKELRRLEHRILEGIGELEPHRRGLFTYSQIELDNFYGIEIDDFAHEVAILSLWLAKHQMNIEFRELFGAEIPLIPLVEAGQIVCGNAARMSWEEVCDARDRETYLLGNPPYAGSSMQKAEQKQDFVDYFGSPRYAKNLDYISLWFFKGADYVAAAGAKLGFVSTNSISQGDHTGLMWPKVLEGGVKISFAYESFLWSNSARGRAGVTCVIVGLAREDDVVRKHLYSEGGRREVVNINPYLIESGNDTIVHARRGATGSLPPMVRGSQPTDGGHLNLTRSERDALLSAEPQAERFVRAYMGASELLHGVERFCLWIADGDAVAASALPELKRHLDAVTAFRRRSSTTAQAMADRPHRFLQRPHKDTSAIIVPRHSSERRDYVPMGYVDRGTVISDAANAIYDAEPWLFGLVESRMHMSWVRSVAGRIKSDIRYSAVLVYNTFPTPEITDDQRATLTECAVAVLGAREQHADRTLAELYDPEKMPDGLRQAHHDLDEVVDLLYDPSGFESDEDRLARLFEMYEAAVADESTGEPEPNA